MSFLPPPDWTAIDIQYLNRFSKETLNMERDEETEVILKIVLREKLIRTAVVSGGSIIVLEETPFSDTTAVFPVQAHTLLLLEEAEKSVSILLSQMMPPEIKDDVVGALAKHLHEVAIVAWENEKRKVVINAVIEVKKEFLCSCIGLVDAKGSRKTTIHAS